MKSDSVDAIDVKWMFDSRSTTLEHTFKDQKM